MKTFLTAWLCLCGLSVLGQGVSMRTTNGVAYGTTDIRGGTLTNTTGNLNIGATNNINLFPQGAGKVVLKLVDNSSYMEIDSGIGQSQLGAGSIGGATSADGTFTISGNHVLLTDLSGNTVEFNLGVGTFINANGTTTIDGGNITPGNGILYTNGQIALNTGFNPDIVPGTPLLQNDDGSYAYYEQGFDETLYAQARGFMVYYYVTTNGEFHANEFYGNGEGLTNLSTSADTWAQVAANTSLTPDIGYVVVNADGEVGVTFDGEFLNSINAGNIGSGKLAFERLPSGVPTNTFIYTGSTNIGNLATSLLIKINHTMPDTNYVPSVSFISAALGAGISSSYSSITPTNFTVNLSAGIAGGEPLRWSVIYSP